MVAEARAHGAVGGEVEGRVLIAWAALHGRRFWTDAMAETVKEATEK